VEQVAKQDDDRKLICSTKFDRIAYMYLQFDYLIWV